MRFDKQFNPTGAADMPKPGPPAAGMHKPRIPASAMSVPGTPAPEMPNGPFASEMPAPGTPAPEMPVPGTPVPGAPEPGMPDFAGYLESEQFSLISSLRELWIWLAIRSRSLIVSASAGLRDIQAITDVLSALPESFSAELGKYFEPQEADRFAELLQEFISTTEALIAAEKSDEERMTGQETANLYRDAGRIASYLASINPYWNRQNLEELVVDYIEILLAGLVARMSGDYRREMTIFEYLLAQAVKIADYLAEGIARKFRP